MEQPRLRELTSDDASELVRMARQWTSRPQVEEFVADLSSFENASRFIAGHMRSTRRLVGIWAGHHLAGLIMVRLDGPHAASMDYLLEREYRGHGVMTKACASAINCLFDEMRRHRIEVQCDEANFKSCALLGRLGFRTEGVRRDAASYGGFYGNVVVFGMLATEWSPPNETLQWTGPVKLSR